MSAPLSMNPGSATVPAVTSSDARNVEGGRRLAGGCHGVNNPDRITGGTSRQLRRSDHPSPPRPWPDHTCLVSRCAPETRPDDGAGRRGCTQRGRATAMEASSAIASSPLRSPDVPFAPSREAAAKFPEGFAKEASRGNPWL